MKYLIRIFTFALFISLLVTGCGGAVAPTTEAEPTEEQAGGDTGAGAQPTEEIEETDTGAQPTEEQAGGEPTVLTIGFTASQTGRYNVESTRQINGLNLWIESVNERGGLQVGGQSVTFEPVFYDDESTKERVQELYTRLATEDSANFMISPYSSGLADAAAAVAEQYGTIMITTGAASVETYQKGFTGVYQIYTPAPRYLTGTLDQLRELDPELNRIAFVYETDKFSTDVANAANAYAEELGFEVVLFEGYASETTDFSAIINKIEAAQPDAILGGGHVADGTTLARQINEKGIDVQYIALLVAPPEPTFAELGDAALGIVGPSQWEPDVTYSAEAADSMGIEWYGPTVQEFDEAYTASFGEEPSYHAAGGYAAGLLLEKALLNAGSTDPEAIKAALDAMDVMTFFGHISFDTSAENHGLQAGHSMVYIQWQHDDAGNLVKQVVWPADAATAETLFPISGE